MLSSSHHHRGFTIIELLTVIVILSVITVLGSHFVVQLIRGQQLLESQWRLMTRGEITLLRLQKQVRSTVPHSLRVTNGNRCVKFLPVVAQGLYVDPVPDRDNKQAPSGRNSPIGVLHHSVDGGTARYLVIGAEASGEVYGNAADSIAAVDSLTATSIRLTANHRWRRNSPRQQFYLTDNPQAFCLLNNELRYYPQVEQTANNVDINSGYQLLLTNVTNVGRAFDVDNPNSDCQQCLEISLALTVGDWQWLLRDKLVSHYGP